MRFVPLIGEQGWTEDGGSEARRGPLAAAPHDRRGGRAAARYRRPGLRALFDRFADARVVLLGEASHGTSRILPRPRGDHPAADRAARLHHRRGRGRLARRGDASTATSATAGAAKARSRLRALPDLDVAQPRGRRLRRWLRGHNEGRRASAMAGLLRARPLQPERLDARGDRLSRQGRSRRPPRRARALRLPDALAADPAAYGRMAMSSGLSPLRGRRGGDAARSAGQAARLCGGRRRACSTRRQRPARRECRALLPRHVLRRRGESWNLRDTPHVRDARAPARAQGPEAKAVVWAHNSHIGDARFTEMGIAAASSTSASSAASASATGGALIGFGTHTGTVAAADDWDGPMEIKRCGRRSATAMSGSATTAGRRFLLDLRRDAAAKRPADGALLERFIGVIYRPETERWSHYSDPARPVSTAEQFDAWVWFDETARPVGAGDRRAGDRRRRQTLEERQETSTIAWSATGAGKSGSSASVHRAERGNRRLLVITSTSVRSGASGCPCAPRTERARGRTPRSSRPARPSRHRPRPA